MNRMHALWIVRALACAALVVTTLPVGATPVRTTNEGLSVVLTTDPPVIALGRSRVYLAISQDGRPLSDAEVRVMVRMPGMDMGEREETARPVEGKPGMYAAPAVFAMAGAYVADVSVVSAGKERKLQLKLATGMNTGEERGRGNALALLGYAALTVLAVYTVVRMRRTGQKLSLRGLTRPGVWMSILLLAGALVAAVYAVRNWRRPGAMTPIEAQAMEMATPPPPGVAPVVVATVDHGPVDRTVTAVGQVAGWADQDIFPRVQGWILDMPVYVGSRVRKGDLLARLDTSEVRPIVEERAAGVRSAQQSRHVAEAEVDQAASALEQTQADVRAAESSVQAASADVAAAQASLAEAEENLGAARLAVGEATAAAHAAEEEHTYRDAELRRTKALRERGAVSVQELERARADAASAVAARDQARLRVRQAEAAVRSAEARVRSAEAGVVAARQRQSIAREQLAAMRSSVSASRAMLAASQSKLRMARAGVEQAQAMLGAARTSERYSEIRAPADGVVTQRLVAPGVLVRPGQAILRMSQIRPVRLQAAISEADLADIRLGAAVEAWRHDNPEQIIRTRVSSIASLVDPETRTGMVEAVWAGASPALAVGEAITIRITVASRPHALRVPARAVTERVGGGLDTEGRSVTHYVWVARPEGSQTVARRVAITPGLRGDRYVEVLSGLASGDRVVIGGGDALRDGDEVVIADTEPGGGRPAQAGSYICTMCPDVKSDKPGRCPRCGMALVREGSVI